VEIFRAPDGAVATAQTRREYVPVGFAAAIHAVEGLRNDTGSILYTAYRVHQ